MKNRSSQLSVLLLACVVVAGSGVPFAAFATPAHAAEAAAASVAISKDQAVQKARTLFEITEDQWVLSNSELRSSQDPITKVTRSTWQLNFNASDQGPAGVSVTIDSNTGRVLAMSRYNKFKQPTGNTTREEAAVIAQNLLKKLEPNLLAQTVLTSDDKQFGYEMAGYHTFTNERKVGDAYVLGDMLQVRVAPDGTVTSYTLKWTDAKFPAFTPPQVDRKAADEIYAKTLDMRLGYTQQYNSKREALLAYSPAYSWPNFIGGYSSPSGQPIIDAQTGKTLGPDGKEVVDVNRPADEPLVKDGPLAPIPRTTPLTEEEAKQLADSSGLVPNGAKLTEITYSESTAKVWNLRYASPNTLAEKSPEINLSLNALTGELVTFNTWNSRMASGDTKMSQDALKNKAIEIVKKSFKDRTGGLIINGGNHSNEDSFVSFYFQLAKNGIPTSSGVNITLDATNGSVRDVYGDFLRFSEEQPNYPSPTDIVSADKAKSVYLEHRPLRLTYVFPNTQDGSPVTPKLVYTPTVIYSAVTINAKTGEWYDLSNGMTPAPPVLPSDIKGHWAEKVLTTFVQQGLLELSDGKANPDQKLTRGGLVRLLADASHAYYPPNTKPTFQDVPVTHKYFNQIEGAVQRGWISKDAKFRPNDTVSREETAAMFARVLGLKDLSAHREIFQVPYSDQASISDWAFGSVSIAYGLGTMRGAGNEFRPHAEITLAEAVTMISRLPQGVNGPIYK